MIRPRSLISSVVMFSLLATLFNGPLGQVAANNRHVDVPATTDDEKGLRFRLSNGVERPSPKGVRATTPGQFIVPPAKAEEMYHPETFGRSKSDRVRVE